MSKLPDRAARLAALTAIDRSLLVEAGAGSGKTALLAGRVAVLLANAIAPKHIAAITFTEFAASELLMRIDTFTQVMAQGGMPREIAQAFPRGLSAEQRATIERARNTLDQLTCTTIHGFAQALIKPYPAEADIDPGAEIVDPAEADIAFGERYEAWLRAQLSGQSSDGIVAELVLADQGGSLNLVSEVARFLRHNRDARPAAASWSREIVTRFVTTVRQFKDDLNRLKFCEQQTETTCRAFIDLARALDKPSLATAEPSNRAILQVMDLPRDEACFTQNGARRKLQTLGRWREAARIAGRSKTEGERAHDGLNARYDACHDGLDEVMSAVAGEVLIRLAHEMQSLMAGWRDYKRAAGLLDFDDLLHTARDLLVRDEEVRQALAKRYRHVLVDEFQDTDPLQIEILWLLCGDKQKGSDKEPLARALRHGALFLVGDPKQAIYRFRGADVNAYIGARSAMGKTAFLEITANFRSVESILRFVNGRFKNALSPAAGQPGFTALLPAAYAIDGGPAVKALDIPFDGDKPKAAQLRDAEAERVAELCTRLVGNVLVRDHEAPGNRRPCRFGDIALLAPAGTDLWRFEQALEDRGIPVSTQAGKGFFRRQEIHDAIALARTLADARDTLAFGALLRGPSVGLSEAELLDIVEALPVDPARPERLPCLDLRTDAAHVCHELARSVLEILQSLRRRARGTTPYMLLADAIAALNTRAQLRQRFKSGAERAIANIDLFLEMARAYDVRGLLAFARDMRANWEDATRQVEGRPDAEEEAVSLMTVHAAKGLEWPIVIPINMTGTPISESALVQDRRSNRFSVPVLGVNPTGYADLQSWSEGELARERVRLWYVATTRARDLLVLPRHSAKLPEKCWARIVDFDLASLPALELKKSKTTVAPDQGRNRQSPAAFAAEAGRIAASGHVLVWQRPSRDEMDTVETPTRVRVFESPEQAEGAAEFAAAPVAGSSARGIMLHKLIEEVLLEEIGSDRAEIERRARELMAQLAIEPADDPAVGISPSELAATVVRTLNFPEIARLRAQLVPERTIYGQQITPDREILVSGITDAVAVDERRRLEKRCQSDSGKSRSLSESNR